MNASTDRTAGDRDPSDLEREADEIRADMDRTLDALERKFSPGQLVDRVVGYMRNHGGDVTRQVGEAVRNNPVPVLMTVAGIAWLLTSTLVSRRTSSGEFEDEVPELGPESEVAGSSGLRSRMQDRVAQTRERIRESRYAAANRMSAAMEATRARTERVQSRVQTIVEEQPLALGALALAVGAIIGAAIPTTQYENRTVGRVRDRAIEKAKQAGERKYDDLRRKLETQQDVEVTGRAH